MRGTVLFRAKQAPYQPMIKFLGPRKNVEHEPHAPAPHPAAPQEIKDTFQSLLSKLQSSSSGPENPSSNPKGQSLSSSSKGEVKPEEIHGAGKPRVSEGGGGGGAGESGGRTINEKVSGPMASKPADYENFWEAPGYLWKIPEVGEREMEAVMSGGATDVRTTL